MTIQDQIEVDLKDAMRAKQAERLSVLRMAKSALMNATIEKYGAGGKLSDPEALVVIRKQVKQREDSIAGFETGGRTDLADKERREIEILNQYLPKPLSDEEIKALVQDAITESKATSKAQLGQVMKIATEKAAGRVDGKTLSQYVREKLP
ncbi:MAG: GatB/YqeY domain-containing protein [Verrucomicrobia bacterium]|nr:GatB/YqeY domain-containing protein [Verrucomicrobiota bacterium]